ncbi:MAG TPA: hypothetical protein VHC39_14085 [Rhizomicrobium sp.]|nr:hypothetical protein [Rhizomicrobium sp.]
MAVMAIVSSGAWAWFKDTASVGGVAGAVYAAIQLVRQKLGERPVLEWKQVLETFNAGSADQYQQVSVQLTIYNRSPAQLELRGLKVIEPAGFQIPSFNNIQYGNYFGVWQMMEPYAPSSPVFPKAHAGFFVGRPPLPKIRIKAVLVSSGAWLWATKRTFAIKIRS